MTKIPFTNGEFITSALTEKHFPTLLSPTGKLLVEIAIVGRSNVGKSSLINNLLRKKTLAKVSSTPGKTQTINFFIIDQTIGLVDLPGYGYAKVSKELREKWGSSIDHYLSAERPLALLLLLVDVRRGLGQEDLLMAEWCAKKNKPLVVLFTKSDKSKERERNSIIQSSLDTLKKIPGLILSDFISYSIHDSKSRELLIRSVESRLKEVAEPSIHLNKPKKSIPNNTTKLSFAH